MKYFLAVFAFVFSTSIWAAILCPPDSCNPFNGCVDGCSQSQKTCGAGSVASCLGKELYSTCSLALNPKLKGYCSAVGTVGHDQVSCSCD